MFVVSGLTAGVAAFMGASFYGSASCVDATGYELYVIASAVVGGASLSGGKGSAVSAMLGALLIVLIRQSIRTLHFDQNYEWIIIGCAIIVAVVLDQASARLDGAPPGARRGTVRHNETRREENAEMTNATSIALARSWPRWRSACSAGDRLQQGGSSPGVAEAPAASRRAEDRDDRQELDQSGVPLGAHRRGGGGEGAVAEAQRAGRDRLADAAGRRRSGAGAAASRRPSTKARPRC